MTEARKLAAMLVADWWVTAGPPGWIRLHLARLAIGVIVPRRDQPAAAFESEADGLFAVRVVSLIIAFFQMVSLGTIFSSPSSEWI